VNGGELFTHLVQRVRFKEQEVTLYSGEIVLALEHLHKVKLHLFSLFISFAISLNGASYRGSSKRSSFLYSGGSTSLSCRLRSIPNPHSDNQARPHVSAVLKISRMLCLQKEEEKCF